MLREASLHTVDWCEKTMSMMREKQFEACEKRLCQRRCESVFSRRVTNNDAQRLYEQSFYSREDAPGAGLTTIKKLRARVRDMLPVEAMYLSEGENSLLERLLIAGGRIELNELDDIGAAEALASRLWVSLAADNENWTIELPEVLHTPLARAISQRRAHEARETLFRYDATINGLLYIAGFLHSSQPMELFLSEVICAFGEAEKRVALRYLKASFEYMDGGRNELILLHPGLADPYGLIAAMESSGQYAVSLTPEIIAGGMSGIFPEEVPLHESMCGSLICALRPEYDVSEAAEDLRMLAKQGVSLSQMRQVMETMLLMMPTDAMQMALAQLHSRTPRWPFMGAALKH